jgi:hypothetical protein
MFFDEIVNISGFWLANYNLWQNNLTLSLVKKQGQ